MGDPGSARLAASTSSPPSPPRPVFVPVVPIVRIVRTPCRERAIMHRGESACSIPAFLPDAVWGVWLGVVREGGRGVRARVRHQAHRWVVDAAGGNADLLELLEVSAALLMGDMSGAMRRDVWPGGVVAGQTGEIHYFRRRGPIRSSGDLNAWDPPRALRISDEGIAQLQQILKERFGLEYSPEQTQEAGRAILRLFGYKLLRELKKERLEATATSRPRRNP